MISNMAEPIWVKLSGFIKESAESVLAKEFFKKTQILKTLFSKIALGHWVQSIPPNSLEVDGLLRVIRTYGRMSSRMSFLKNSNIKNFVKKIAQEHHVQSIPTFFSKKLTLGAVLSTIRGRLNQTH